jgi:hypothetical protein
VVQIIENWSDLEGEVVDLGPSEQAGFVVVRLRVEAVRDVPGVANLLADSAGSELSFNVPRAVAERAGVAPGARVAARVRRASLARAFVHPEHLRVVGSATTG